MIDNQKLLDECREAMEDSGYPTAYFEQCVLSARDTLPKVMIENYKTSPNEISMRKKDLGIWYTYTWAEVYENVKCKIYEPGPQEPGVGPGRKSLRDR